MRAALLIAALAAAVAPAACTRIPDLGRQASAPARAAPWPDLIPLGPVLAQADAIAAAPEPAAGLPAEATALRRRADALRRPVIDDETRARMDRAASGS